MVSIVVCSRKPQIDKALAENIGASIGCQFELVVIDNSTNSHSIAEAYNLGIERSTGDIVCFIHDDILFCSPGWGNVLLELFDADGQLGLIGVAGAKIKCRTASAWWDCDTELVAMNLIQHYAVGAPRRYHDGFDAGTETEIVALDGVFMALRKDARIRFNESLRGFHCYDLCLSLECRKLGYRVIASDKILIEHFSNGRTDRAWIEASIAFHKLYQHQLPLTLSGTGTTREQEMFATAEFFGRCILAGDTRNAFLCLCRSVALGTSPRFQIGLLKLALRNWISPKAS